MSVGALACVLLFAVGALAVQQVYQPVYQQQVAAAPQQYRQVYLNYAPTQGQAQAHPVFEPQDGQQQQQYVAQNSQAFPQPLLGSVDRQIQKAAQHVAGPVYAQQVQSVQLQNQAQQAQIQAQRNALRLATAPRAQPAQYQRALQQQQPDEAELQEDYNTNPSYQFGFDVKDDLYTNYQNRKEQRDGDKITGSYSVVDSDGFIRTVTYTADAKEGFKAEVSRQPTDIVVKVPQPKQHIDPQIHQQSRQQQRQQYYEVPVSTPESSSEQGKQRVIYQYQ